MQHLLRTLNQTYKNTPALYQFDNSPEGFQWIDVDAQQQSIFSFIRYAKQTDTDKKRFYGSEFTTKQSTVISSWTQTAYPMI